MTLRQFSDLPFGVILEVCSFLDLRSLVALADTSNTLRSLSNTYKSYWLPSAYASDLMLPLPARPWLTFSPSELSIAVRRALFREFNLSQDHPILYSHTMISWPYSGTLVSPEGKEIPLGTGLLAQPFEEYDPGVTAHDSGEWLFMFSPDFILRILHLRTGAIVLEELLHEHEAEENWTWCMSTSLDCISDVAARYAVAFLHLQDSKEDEKPDPPALLKTFYITLNPESVTASMVVQACAPLILLPRRFDIAGDYAILMEDIEKNGQERPGPGVLHALDWRTGKSAKLPPLLDSFCIVCFPEYFMSLGATPEGTVELQVVSLPPKTPDIPNQFYTEETSFLLAASIPLNSDSEEIGLHCSDQSASIYHQYRGREIGTIRVWIRDDFFLGSYSIFTIGIDPRGAPHTWFKPCSTQIENREKPQYTVVHTRMTEKQDTSTMVTIGTCGRRFFWWRDIVSLNTNPLSISADIEQPIRLVLYSSDTDGLSPLPPSMGEPEPGTSDAEFEVYPMGSRLYEEQAYFLRRYEACMVYPTRQMECPYSINLSEASRGEPIANIAVDEWSGNVICVLTSGDIIVLRYGHS